MSQPLAELMRPKSLSEIVGQDHLVGPNGFITQQIQKKTPLSIILWGPPGSGKTSIARLYAKAFDLPFQSLNATFSGVSDLKRVFLEGEQQPLFAKKQVLFVDEIHRFNKAQQDAFLPYVEKGSIILVGATAENPSFYLNNALLSRVRVLEVLPLTSESLQKLLDKYETQFKPLPLSPEQKRSLLHMAQGDGRYLLNCIENLHGLPETPILTDEALKQLLTYRPAHFDRGGDYHYNLISALHKSLRGSDPDASLYWFQRMLAGGEDPLFIARRLIRMASEDVGLADPQALVIAIAARDAYEMLGSPEGELALAQAVVYLALAPKSNAIYTAFKASEQEAKETTQMAPPKIILNAPTPLMKEKGYGKGYRYDHDEPNAFSGQNYFPDDLPRSEYYFPVERGFEREMRKRKAYFEKLRQIH
jgi:putative ATPase